MTKQHDEPQLPSLVPRAGSGQETNVKTSNLGPAYSIPNYFYPAAYKLSTCFEHQEKAVADLEI